MTEVVDFTEEAIKDLSEIARYTAETWGHQQAIRYAKLLDKQFQAIADGRNFSRATFSSYQNIRVCRCQHHYIFFIRPEDRLKPVILAVLHERMDLLERLKGRL